MGDMQKRIDRLDIALLGFGVFAVAGLVFLSVLSPRAEAAQESAPTTVNLVSSPYLDFTYTPVAAGTNDPAYIALDPSVSGGLGTGAATLAVNTSNASGFTVTMRMFDNTNANNLVSGDFPDVIGPTAAMASALAENTWGFYAGTPGTIAWNPVPLSTASGVTVLTGGAGGVSGPITFGIRVGWDLPSIGGTEWTNTVRFTATDNV